MSDIDNLTSLLTTANSFYSEVRSVVIAISTKAKAGEYTKEDLCDLGFLCREIVSKSEEIRKDIGATKALVDRVMCLKAMATMLTTQSGEDTVRGELSSGKPHYKKSVTLPKQDTEEYRMMCEYFGITEEGAELGGAKISWRGVCNHITELAELGKSIPKFLPKIHDDYTVIHRRKSM